MEDNKKLVIIVDKDADYGKEIFCEKFTKEAIDAIDWFHDATGSNTDIILPTNEDFETILEIEEKEATSSKEPVKVILMNANYSDEPTLIKLTPDQAELIKWLVDKDEFFTGSTQWKFID